ncbi:MAG: alkaline phosphatase D family protein [Acidobacteriota bacterium]|nr:alkaline phosphatase D family protein [Acidobacteriota bacterium]
MNGTRREFLGAAALIGLSPVIARLDPFLRLQPGADGRNVFLHGVASGDPLADRVILWTRVSGTAASSRPRVRWEVARDETFRQVIRRGEVTAVAARDFTVKVDVTGLQPGSRYHYRFVSGGERSPAGRTRTLPVADVARIRLAVASCSNLPAGYFNAYRGIANRADLDAVLHLGDYYYEYANIRYGDGTRFGRIPRPDREIVSLEDYRTRHAQYKTDPDLQEAHRQHPWITVWDDHEVTNNTWRGGAQNHNPEEGEGDWTTRRNAAVQAYYEWMPVRESGTLTEARIYRTFRLGSMADLVMLDTRVVARDQQVPRDQLALIEDPQRSLLGSRQEAWLFSQLSSSQARGTRWQLLGQQVMFAATTPWGTPAGNADAWDGYRPARDRVVDHLETTGTKNAVILTGDVHSSWAYDIAKDPWTRYDATTGRGAAAIEFVTPSVTSPSGWTAENAGNRLRNARASRPHLHWADGLNHGYVVVTITRDAVQGDFWGVPTIEERTDKETFVKGFVSEYNHPHLVEAASPSA